jgi:hypothetical protein
VDKMQSEQKFTNDGLSDEEGDNNNNNKNNKTILNPVWKMRYLRGNNL